MLELKKLNERYRNKNIVNKVSEKISIDIAEKKKLINCE